MYGYNLDTYTRSIEVPDGWNKRQLSNENKPIPPKPSLEGFTSTYTE
jgi:hypothetical protein